MQRIVGFPRGSAHSTRLLLLCTLGLPSRLQAGFTQTRMDVVSESVIEAYSQRAKVKGLRMVYEPKDLRFFQARFAPIMLM